MCALKLDVARTVKMIDRLLRNSAWENFMVSIQIRGLIAAALLTTPAHAGNFFDFEPAKGGAYVSVYGGGNFRSGGDFEGVSNPQAGVPGPTGVAGAPILVNLDYDVGYQVGGAVGAQLPFKYWNVFHPRLEIEVSYADVDVGSGSFNGGNQIFSGDQSTVFVFLNNYSDIRWTENQRLVPYIGGGLGVAFVDSDVGYFPVSAATPGNTFAVTDSDTAFASHIAAGISAPLGVKAEAFVEGRYTRIYSAGFERRFVGGGADLFVADISDRLSEFTATAGLRWRF